MSKSCYTNRKGLAPLEMILALPVIVFLFVLIFYVAASCMQKYELVSLCRTHAWDKRYYDSEKNSPPVPPPNLKVTTKVDKPATPFQLNLRAGEIVSSGNGSQVKTDLIFDRLWNQKIESQHVVLARTWDHEEVKMDRSVLQIEKVLSMNAKTNFLSQWSKVKNMLQL